MNICFTPHAKTLHLTRSPKGQRSLCGYATQPLAELSLEMWDDSFCPECAAMRATLAARERPTRLRKAA